MAFESNGLFVLVTGSRPRLILPGFADISGYRAMFRDFLDRREGILGSARLKVNPNWVLLAGAGYDLHANSVTQTQIGLGYIDDCLILALNYITSYAYSGSVSVNHTYMMQVSLRTLGGNTGTGAPSTGMAGGTFGAR